MLHLREFSATGQLQGAALHLAFPSALLPHVALDASGQGIRMYALTARGFLHCFSLPAAAPAPAPSRGGPAIVGQPARLSRLAGVSADNAMRSISLSAGARKPSCPATTLHACSLLRAMVLGWPSLLETSMALQAGTLTSALLAQYPVHVHVDRPPFQPSP